VNTKEVSKPITVAIKYVTKYISLSGITSITTKDVKIFGDIDLVVTDLSTNTIIVNKPDFWNNQGNATNTGIDGNKNSIKNISKILTVTLDEYLLSIKKYRITTYTNVGSWYKHPYETDYHRIVNYNNTLFSFETDGSDIVSSPRILTDPITTYSFQVHWLVY
jgi:hypothetical protein